MDSVHLEVLPAQIWSFIEGVFVKTSAMIWGISPRLRCLFRLNPSNLFRIMTAYSFSVVEISAPKRSISIYDRF